MRPAGRPGDGRVASRIEMAVTVTLPDGKALELKDGATGADAAAAIGPGLARAALAIEVGDPDSREGPGELRDLARELPNGVRVAIVTDKSGDEALALIRHDAAHVLAAAVMELWPGVKISIGPAIDNGFYYDFEFPEGVAISEADFPSIEERMRAHVRASETFERVDVTPAQARERFVAESQDYKVELIEDLVLGADSKNPLQTVSLYTNGPFTDLCKGPHAPTTKSVGAFKLLSVAGAYWRGDSTRTMLTRIYGTAFFSKAQLEEYLELLEREGTGPPQARERARPVHVLRALPGDAVLAAGGHSHLERAHRPVAARERGARIYGGAHPNPLRRGPVEAVWSLGQVPREHVLH